MSRTPAAFSRRLYELLSSMRFAVSLLTVLAIASVIGTVLKQNEPYNNYLAQFGQFWFPVFKALGLYAVYHSAWFLLILAFLVTSTSLCIMRQAPGMLKEMRSFRVNAREASLRQFAHHHIAHTALTTVDAAARARDYLATQGYAFRIRARDDAQGRSLLIAGRAGTGNRLGYLFAHSAIVLICIGGLLDGDLPLKAEMLLGAKKAADINLPFNQIGAESRLDTDHWSYRGNLFLPEGKRGNIAVINVDDGGLLQPLPFTVELKRFNVDFYSTGMPKRFASDIVIIDGDKRIERTVEVNKPVEYRGVTLYQASFDDGGSKLKLQPWYFSANPAAKPIDTEVGAATSMDGNKLRAEITGFRAFNVEDMTSPDVSKNTADKNSLAILNRQLGNASPAQRTLKNVGPSFSYKLRNDTGQAREYNNYMLPITQDGRQFFMSGMRESPADDFRYLRIPADTDGKPDTWFALRAEMLSDKDRALIARRFAIAAMHGPDISETMRTRLSLTAERTLQMFAAGGFDSIGTFINGTVPAEEREKAADVFVRVLQGCAWEALQLTRQNQHQKPLDMDSAHADFVRDSINAISDSFRYGAPVWLALDSFDQVQASVLQVTRSPGRNIVYLGCALLVAGVCFMLYVRERRLFVLLKDSGEVLIAYASNRRTLDDEREFSRHRDALTRLFEDDA
ncbi:MAG TPA: cytochrome c biogenesis protein ResB [Rhodocyclaceae bacterium]|nr:cytochrome c biogenesis protein ResB [Rhodocyclaceae bacterium]